MKLKKILSNLKDLASSKQEDCWEHSLIEIENGVLTDNKIISYYTDGSKVKSFTKDNNLIPTREGSDFFTNIQTKQIYKYERKKVQALDIQC